MKKNNNTELKDFFEDENKTINAETMFHKNMKVYGLDVLEDRALADYRDGLKPAQRRLMWTAKELKATWENKTVKSARITGDCFTGDTEILTVNNEKLPIAKLEKMIEQGENVYTFSSSETGEIEVSKVVKCWKKTETDNLVKVYLDNDTYFECTPDHKIMLRDGTYQKAIELKENTSLMPLYFSDNTLDGRRQIIDNKIGKTISVYKLAGKHKDCDMSELLNEENWNKYIRNNNELTYKTAISKQVYSQLFANYNHKVLKVEKLKLNEKVAVYNVEVDSKYHNFPLGNGVFVKNCMGKYHPHSSSYGSLGTLVDCEYPMVYGQGNWGSLTDGAAAERYTEAKISQLGMKMLECMDVADYVPNYTGEFKEPIVLTTRVPNFFINECAGIAVGLSCNIPAHNLKEVVEAMKVVVKKGEATKLKDIMKYLKGPDYKYGGKIISTHEEIESLYKNGEGAIKYECDYTLTREKKNILLTVTGFCPGFSPESFINKMISLIDEKVVIYVNDSSTKDEPCKLEVLLSNEEDFEKKIHKHLIKSVSYRYYAIEREKSNDVEKDVDTKVIMPNLVELMNMWVNWRKKVETKMCEVEKKITEEKKQKLDWRLLASQNLKVVVKGLEDKDPIKYIAENMPGLKGKTFATDAAKYICDQRVISLQKVDQDKIKNEIQDNVKHIKELENDIANIDDVVIRELDKLKPFYRDRKLKV